MQGLLVAQVVVACLVGSALLSLGLNISPKDMSLYRSYFPCRECDAAARAACPDTSHCVEVVKPHGICGCCYVCAQLENERCGVYLNPCGRGLRCRAPPRASAAKSSLTLILLGEGRCLREPEPLFEDENYIGGF